MSWIGILFGLAAGLAQSTAYVFSRRFIVADHGGSGRLLVLGHTIMGVIALLLLPLLATEQVWAIEEYGYALLGTAGFYLVGQAGLFVALRRADASRVAPLLGLKVMWAALIWAFLLHQPTSGQQWAAVGLSVSAAFILNYTGGSLPLLVVTIVPLTCLSYAVCDICIYALVGNFGARDSFHPPMLSMSLAYILCGLVAVALLPRYGSTRRSDWLAATPYAASWMAAMICLFTALSMAGPVLANIVLSMRGLWSIAIGFVLAKIGMEHLERKVSRGVLARRSIAALLMVTAVALYHL